MTFNKAQGNSQSDNTPSSWRNECLCASRRGVRWYPIVITASFQISDCELSLLLLPQLPRALVHIPKRPLPFSRVSGTSILSPMGQARRVSLRGCNCPAHTAVSSWILASSLQDWTPWQWFLQPPGCPGVCRPPWPLWVCFWSPVWWFSSLWVSS